jgi:uncharacterized protein YxjI
MKKNTFIFSLFIFISSAFATDMPDQVDVKEHWISLTKSYDILSGNLQLGTLYKRFFSFLPTYDFYNFKNIKIASAKTRFFSLGAHLDIYDNNNVVLGSVEEKIFSFFPTFDIYDEYLTTKLATAEMNFWGTRFDVLDPFTRQEIAIISRPFFQFKHDWSISVTNRALLERKNIDSRVLLTVVAVQGEIEDWKNSFPISFSNSQIPAPEMFKQQLKQISISENLKDTETQNQQPLIAMMEKMDKAFKAIDKAYLTDEERMNAFMNYCIDYLNNPNHSHESKSNLLNLLKLKFKTDHKINN